MLSTLGSRMGFFWVLYILLQLIIKSEFIFSHVKFVLTILFCSARSQSKHCMRHITMNAYKYFDSDFFNQTFCILKNDFLNSGDDGKIQFKHDPTMYHELK